MANIQDVAKKAGVSISTVSRVLNGSAKVNSEVKKGLRLPCKRCPINLTRRLDPYGQITPELLAC